MADTLDQAEKVGERIVDWQSVAEAEKARADEAEASLRFIANAVKACGAEPGAV